MDWLKGLGVADLSVFPFPSLCRTRSPSHLCRAFVAGRSDAQAYIAPDLSIWRSSLRSNETQLHTSNRLVNPRSQKRDSESILGYGIVTIIVQVCGFACSFCGLGGSPLVLPLALPRRHSTPNGVALGTWTIRRVVGEVVRSPKLCLHGLARDRSN